MGSNKKLDLDEEIHSESGVESDMDMEKMDDLDELDGDELSLDDEPSGSQAYGTKSSNPAGGTVIIVYVATFPAPFRIESSNSLLPHFLQKYTVARCNSSHFVHFLARILQAFTASINSGFADNLHTLKAMKRTTGASSTKVLC